MGMCGGVAQIYCIFCTRTIWAFFGHMCAALCPVALLPSSCCCCSLHPAVYGLACLCALQKKTAIAIEL